ncbi:hypothetical protein HRED_07297 [Candidatus Haloredivivus sp. G17]|nr:hypothetical protein HRED_07297 [Candidatus Haloredivivus sp. G17]
MRVIQATSGVDVAYGEVEAIIEGAEGGWSHYINE